MQNIEINMAGDILVEGQHIGQLQGFQFLPIPSASDIVASDLVTSFLDREFQARAQRVLDAVDSAFILSHDGILRWLGEPIARLYAGENIRTPRILLLADSRLSSQEQETLQQRLVLWMETYFKRVFAPLLDLEAQQDLSENAQKITQKLGEHLGIVERYSLLSHIRALTQEERSKLRKLGVRFGSHHIYIPLLLKPAPRTLAVQLWGVRQQEERQDVPEFESILALVNSGRTSLTILPHLPPALYLMAGMRVCGERAIRVDILERLADLIRAASSYRPGITQTPPPPGAADGEEFTIAMEMTSIVGCAGEAFSTILRSLGYVSTSRPSPALTIPLPKDPPTSTSEEDTPPSPARMSLPDEPPVAMPLESTAETPETMPALVEVWHYPSRAERGTPSPAKSPPRCKGEGRTSHMSRFLGLEKSQRKARKQEAPLPKAPPRPKPRREKPLDPDSPFAKLLELKAKLEEQAHATKTKG